MLELGVGAALFRGLGWLMAALFIAALATSLMRPRTLIRKVVWTTIVIGIFIGPLLPSAYRSYEFRKRLGAAQALFDEKCKSAGEKITRTVEDVDGVVWLKWRPREINRADQFRLDDPYGHDCYGDECIKRLLRVTQGANLDLEGAKQHNKGYDFVESFDPSDGQRYRYSGVIKSIGQRTPDQIEQYKANSGGRDPGPDIYGFALQRDPITQFAARYGITWEDVSTREDREHWIAGGSLKLLDLQTNEVVAERTGYLMDSGQGSTAGFRDPWGWASSYGPRCPQVFESGWDFSKRVLRPKTRESKHGQ
jgi:hypothetical protein